MVRVQISFKYFEPIKRLPWPMEFVWLRDTFKVAVSSQVFLGFGISQESLGSPLHMCSSSVSQGCEKESLS